MNDEARELEGLPPFHALALLITQDGKRTQSILGILVSSDVPALVRALSF